MVRVDSNNNIYITKGDTGSITLSLMKDGSPVTDGSIILTVRSATNLDNVLGQATGSRSNGAYLVNIGSQGELAAIHEGKRKKYVYDIKYTTGSNEKITFLGGDTSKLYLYIT